ncbi:MAG: DNA polymerase I [Deltaproteobacteria bacterium]|nr:DNA polymerase I [Deltaproteobacteria bacterium]
MSKKEATLYLIDGSSYIYRAFYAVRHLSTSSGIPTNAIYGFVGMLNRILRERGPSHIAIALDAPGPTFRHDLSPDYKATRPKMPEDLAKQIPFIKRLIEAFGIPNLEIPGYEADDIIGTLAVWASGQGAKVVIVSGDKDMLQLVTPQVQMWDTMKDEVFGPAEVEEKFGVPPAQLVEVMGLAGDSSDNIPGVPGVGPKTAQRLIKEFGSIDNLLSKLEKVTKEREREKLKAHAEQATMSRELAEIKCDVPLEKDWEQFELGKSDRQALVALYRELEFKKFLQQMEGEKDTQESGKMRADYKLITSLEAMEKIISRALKTKKVAISVMTAEENAFGSDLVGLALAWEGERGCHYFPFGEIHKSEDKQLDGHSAVNLLAPLLADPHIAKVVHHSKKAWIDLKRQGIELSGIHFDPMLAAYVLDPSKRVQDLEVIAKEYLNESLASYHDLVGTGRNRRALADLPVEQILAYAGDQAVYSLQLSTVLEEKIKEANQTRLFRDIEIPLVRVLARMEMKGVKIDVALLENLDKDFSARLEEMVEKIFDLAGESFNINSPQQLGRILFDKLALPISKKTKTGYSTSVDVLTALAPYHPLPREVLDYRSLTKLKNTYIDTLPRMVNQITGRIHTSYNQTGTVTGRLSSSEPNLQNIPVRTEEGREIRRAFVADSGHSLISADYSQIELRILAHYSRDEALIDAIRKGEDIHLRTAAEIFEVEAHEVTAEMRRQAKTINFGIIYGMSAFRLAKDLGIPQKKGRQIIERYFDRYEGVRTYMEETPKLARKQGFIATLLNRKRFLPDLKSGNHNVRQFAERTAINTPIQGSAADIIKMAMIRIDAELERKSLPARMIMQVHDELVFEVEAGRARDVATLVQHEMESVVSLAVPLVVEVGIGFNWNEAH